MTTLRKTIIKRSELRNTFSKERNAKKKWSDYKQKRNYYSNVLEEFKTRYFNNLNVKDVTEKKRFLKTIKPFFIGKTKKNNKIILTEKYDTIKKMRKFVNILILL